MYFALSDEQNLFRNTVRDFAEAELSPRAHEVDVTGSFNWEAVHKMGPLGLLGLSTPEEYGGPGVDAVSAGLDASTRTLSVRAVIVSDTRLKPQMLATVVVEGVGSVPAVFVPDDAVQLIQGKPHVFLARPDGKGGARFERREVVLGARIGGRIAVLHGLVAGDVVVTAGSFAVKAEFQKATMPKMEM